LKARLAELEAAESAGKSEEHQLRQEHSDAEVAFESARRRELKALDKVEEAKRLQARSRDFLSGEFSELMQKIASHEQEEKMHEQLEAAWKAELDALVLEQAKFMTRRDELKAEVASSEVATRGDASKATEVEAKAKRMEEKCNKERTRVDLLCRELEALRTEAEQARAEEKRQAQALEVAAASTAATTALWRRLAFGVGFATILLVLWRAMVPRGPPSESALGEAHLSSPSAGQQAQPMPGVAEELIAALGENPAVNGLSDVPSPPAVAATPSGSGSGDMPSQRPAKPARPAPRSAQLAPRSAPAPAPPGGSAFPEPSVEAIVSVAASHDLDADNPREWALARRLAAAKLQLEENEVLIQRLQTTVDSTRQREVKKKKKSAPSA